MTKPHLTIVIFGASGDLAKKKIYPALFRLWKNQMIPRNVTICGYARSKKSRKQFIDMVLRWLPHGSEEESADEEPTDEEPTDEEPTDEEPTDEEPTDEESVRENFISRCVYVSGQYHDAGTIGRMIESNSKSDVENLIHYLAIPPSVFLTTLQSIGAVGMSESGYTRVVVEKPFGHDTESTIELAKRTQELIPEHCLYRIDHYLGKSMVRAIPRFRFQDRTMECFWNRRYIESIEIEWREQMGTLGRGGYFDRYGIVRDVVQNHLMQVLSMVAMEEPGDDGENRADRIRARKVEVLRCVEPIDAEKVVMGQYRESEDGIIPGYLQDPTVPNNSITETYARIPFTIDNERWRGVGFTIVAGKALERRVAQIKITFRPQDADSKCPSEMLIRIQPSCGIYAVYPTNNSTWEKVPFDCQKGMEDAYAHLIRDVVKGDRESFVTEDEMVAAWHIVTPVLKSFSGKSPTRYRAGSQGPAR